jgi:uncharacterized damage-inducible protein DinB
MKELFELYATYNKKANDSMINILKQMPEENIKKDMGTYFKSIFGTLEHNIQSNIMWFRRTNRLFQQKYICISSHEIIKLPDSDIKKRIDAEYKYIFGIKRQLDDLFEQYVKELNEEDFDKRLRYKNMKGEELERTYWNTIVHIFNHETHHRGVISAMLDQLKINNDYSGILQYVK